MRDRDRNRNDRHRFSSGNQNSNTRGRERGEHTYRGESNHEDKMEGGNGGDRNKGGFRERDGRSSDQDRNYSRHDERHHIGRRRDDYFGRSEDDGHPKRRRMSDDGEDYHRRPRGRSYSRSGREDRDRDWDRDRDRKRDWDRDRSRGRGRDNNRRRRSGSSPPLKKEKAEWPSVFEDSGGSYVFDARSGLFYEAASDFFYDPKNKLYYSNEKKLYYRHRHRNPTPSSDDENKLSSNTNNKSEQPDCTGSEEWVEVKPGEGAINGVAAAIGDNSGNRGREGMDKSQDLVVQALQGSNTSTGKQDTRKKINICIKKKFTGSANLKKKYLEAKNTNANSNSNTTEEKQKSLAEKSRNADIAKWAAKRADETNNHECMVLDGNNTSTNSTRKIKVTKDGKPICFLCKRKFADMEKLKQHEKLSSLHKQNLAKKRKMEEVESKKISEYRDRANERRTMYEAETNISVVAIDPSIVNMGPSLEKAREVRATEKVTPEQNLGDANVGNKLLQKLGWKSGEALGRRVDESEGNDTGSGLSTAKMQDKLSKLKQDWERIENLSKKN